MKKIRDGPNSNHRHQHVAANSGAEPDILKTEKVKYTCTVTVYTNMCMNIYIYDAFMQGETNELIKSAIVTRAFKK